MLGKVWKPTYLLVPPVALAIMASCASIGGGTGLQPWAPPGTMRFIADTSWLGTLMSWWQLRSAARVRFYRDHESRPTEYPAGYSCKGCPPPPRER